MCVPKAECHHVIYCHKHFYYSAFSNCVYCTWPIIFGKQVCTAVSVMNILALQCIFKICITIFHGIHQFIHLRSLNVQMTNCQLQFPHLRLYSFSGFNVFFLIKWFNQPQWVGCFSTFCRVLFYLPSIFTELLVLISTIILNVARKN